MAKQAIISIMEEVIGEYVLNIDTENLKFAALRGKIKLENVQLDGDLLGSSVLGSIGLSGFGILSSWAKSVKITIPLKNLEREPTRIEMRGCHILCVPLIPSTASKMYGAGTTLDPRCTLRTRAKRCKLARFEKNFMTGRIPDEGPIAKRILRAVKDVERDLKKKNKRRKSLGNKQQQQKQQDIDDEYSLTSFISDLGEGDSTDMSTTEKTSKDSVNIPNSHDLPELPRDWKVRLREKIMRNLEIGLYDIHIRCEVSEGGLDCCQPDGMLGRKPRRKNDGGLKYDERAFAFGATLDEFLVRTANEKWETGSHEKTAATAATDQLGPNPYDARNNKIISWENCSFYWDDDPPFLISDAELIRSNEHKLSAEKFHARIAAAMSSMYHQQEPGQKIRESLLLPGKKKSERYQETQHYEERPHQFCFQGFKYEVRHRLSNRTEPGPISCSSEFLPFEFNLQLRPHQFIQYQTLKSAMLFQQRFDTMLRQRPNKSPLQKPREWWQYAIGCVTTRPNSRPWQDVVRITQNRKRYIDLVVKKISQPGEYSGFHGGLSYLDSCELLDLEDLLPLEALLAFHLIALRKATSGEGNNANNEVNEESPARGRRAGRTGLGRLFRSRSRSSRRDGDNSVISSSKRPPTPVPLSNLSGRTTSILEAMTVRLGKKIWMTNFKFFHAKVTIELLTASDEEIAKLVCEASGTVRTLGEGKMDYFFDVTRFEAVESQARYDPDRNQQNRRKEKILVIQGESDECQSDDLSSDITLMSSFPRVDTDACTSFIDLPPSGVVCRLAAAKEKGSTKFSISSHPATLVWTRPCFDALAEFFGAPTTEMQTELTSHLKNAATPLARKAQLAFLSQSTLVLHCNIAAPKIWVPFTSEQGSDGALQLDAGNFRMFFSKKDGQPNMAWKMDASDIQVNFARWRLSEVRERITSAAPFAVETLYTSHHGVNSIIRPFHVHAVNAMKQSQNLPYHLSDSFAGYSGPVSCIDIKISPICLNLVDAEVLARAIGKWYSQGVVSVRGRVATRRRSSPVTSAVALNRVDIAARGGNSNGNYRENNGTPHTLSVKVEKFEMAIEGHSKSSFSDEKSIESHETSLYGEFAPPTRTYLVEVFDIVVHRTNHNDTSTTKVRVMDASILQLRDPSEYLPMKERHESSESQYSILEHVKESEDEKMRGSQNGGKSPTKKSGKSEVLSITLFHDSCAHLDEVEIDIDSIILRVTPTSLKDCMKGIRKILELVQLMTSEMERKIHEEGRKARQKGRDGNSDEYNSSNRRPVSPALSANSEHTENQAPEESPIRLASDSSLLFKVTIRDGTLLAGRPTFARENGNLSQRLSRFRQSYSFAVVQVLSNALIMFQSIENPDASGTKTMHMSLDNLSASVDTEFERIPASRVPPMIGPTGAEFRVVYSTENFGCVVSSDISLDCEYLRSCLTPNDLSIFVSIITTMLERLKGVHNASAVPSEKLNPKGEKRDDGLSSMVKYKKRGSGIATNIRAEFQTFSFVVLRTFQSKYGAPELLSFDLDQAKARLGGCVSALSGECSAGISVGFFNSDVSAWEYAVEPFPIKLTVDQMPNELILEMATKTPIQLNLTGLFLRDFSQLDLGLSKENKNKDRTHVLTPSALSTVGLRRATESHSVVIHNFTGMDIDISLSGSFPPEVVRDGVRFHSIGPGVIKHKCCASLDSVLADLDFPNNLDEIAEKTKLTLKLPVSSTELVGEREPLIGLPITSAHGAKKHLHILKPDNVEDSFHSKRFPIQAQVNDSGRMSPETVMTEASRVIDHSYYHAEPVVEWCMQNQRLRSSTVDIYSLEKGKDLLSSSIWSPEEEYNIENIGMPVLNGQNASPDTPSEDASHEIQKLVSSPGRKTNRLHANKSNWLRPYLKNDSPEWTDMTCILRMARERVMLPDSTWMWVNDWSVDVSGEFGESTDADGWEYQADFETFTRTRRFYNRGDSCRRRRWTRTRIIRPPRLDDPCRLLKLVWETSRDESGNFKIEVKSHVTLHNRSGTPLTFFAFSPSWDEEKFIGSSLPGETVHMPVALSSAVYLRLGKSKSKNLSSSIYDYVTTDNIMILPTSYNSNMWLRSSMTLGDVSETDLHFLLHIVSKKGIIDISVRPVMTILNLLPCQLECQLGEVLRPSDKRQMDSRPVISSSSKIKIANVETLTVASGKEGKCTAVNPASKPHISLRVPGYKWSAWQRIVNRRSDSYTWRPSENEEELFINWNRGDVEHGEEFKMMVHFERFGRTGDPLVLIIGVECGLAPTVRVYAQYWVVDKTGFGCHFCESFTDLLGTAPDVECSRRSHLLKEDARDQMIKRDMNCQGHEWSIGMSGMTLYFSIRERIAVSIESGAGDGQYADNSIRSKWTSPMDISNVMPKTVFSVDELGGPRRFELAISVTICPGIFSRTRLITLIPRYQIVNLLKRELVVAQNGCLRAETLIPSQSSVPFHLERQSLPPKVRLGAPTSEERDCGEYDDCWTNGCIQLDKIGITSMRLPTVGILPTKPMVVQAEVRLASKEQSSAVVIVIWSTNDRSNPLYLLRNRTRHTILCRQPLQDEQSDMIGNEEGILPEACGSGGGVPGQSSAPRFECGSEFGPIISSFLGLDRIEEFVWVLRSGDVACFGFDDPEKPHILEWACVDADAEDFAPGCKKAFVEIDAMGTTSSLSTGGPGEVTCQIGAEHSTKVIEFIEKTSPRFSRSMIGSQIRRESLQYQLVHENHEEPSESDGNEDDEEQVAFSLRIDIPALSISVIDNADPSRHGREILMAQFENIFASFSQSREGYHEMELRVVNLQVDNHVPASIHPVLIFCPKNDVKEPVLHISAVRRLQQHSTTYVFRYAAFRLLEVNIFLDRRTAERIAEFIEPVRKVDEDNAPSESPGWVSDLTIEMSMKYSEPDRRAPRDIEMLVLTANSGRMYFEQLHLHPVRLALTFTQEWVDSNQETESLMVFQFIRGMASIADAPLTFTSFVVSHVFESPQALLRVIATHYSSQLTKQIFGILGSLAILGAPADFISNVGTGVRDFFYEPIQGAVHGPRQFIEGLEAGTQSLARGVIVGVVRGAANVTEVVNANLAGLTADDDFIDERKAHQRMLTDAMSRGVTSRTFSDSLYLAGASIARGVRSGAYGIVEQPTRYASKYGPVGFVKGVGKAFVGAVVKPVVGVGDAAALIMNHVSDATSNKQIQAKIPKRLRRALPSISVNKPNCVNLRPYDERAAKAQKIVTGGESVNDVYIGHVNIPSHLIIASDQCLWAIDRRSREPWCVSWEEISHFGRVGHGMRIVVFSQTGLKPYVFQVDDTQECNELQKLLTMHLGKMGNATSNLSDVNANEGLDISLNNIPGVKSRQGKHVFGSCNQVRKRLASTIKDEIDLIEQCFSRVKKMGSESNSFFKTLDDEAWTLVSCWGQVFSGLSSRRCIVASVINGTGNDIQIKSTKLVEGGSPCYSIPTKEFDSVQGVLHAGGVIIFFGWGVVPSLLQPGNVFMHIETNAFIADLSDQKNRDTYTEAMPGYQVGFLEKSYDDAGWWAKYWLVIRKS